MKSPSEYMASRRRSEDKASWKDQLSPRIKSFRGFSRRRSSAKTQQRPEQEFQIVHFPDRPARRITQEEIPSEEECRAFLLQLRRGSLQSHAGTEVISEDGEEEQPEEEAVTWETDFTAARPELAWQTPEDARSEIAEEGIMTARTYSPHPFVGEAKEVKLERLRTSYLPSRESSLRSVVTPLSPPPRRQQEKAIKDLWTWRMPPAQPSRSPTMREPLRPQLHVRQDSGSDPLCRVCHVGLAEASGICQTCSDEYAAPDESPGTPKYTPPRGKAAIPHTLDQIACQRRSSLSQTSSPKTSTSSPPTSPSRRTVQTVLTLQPNPPLTPLSGMPTPQVLARMEGTAQEDDVYEDDWADYYFDDENFSAGEEDREDVDPNGFMLRELSLDEYDKAFASPVSPGAGWI